MNPHIKYLNCNGKKVSYDRNITLADNDVTFNVIGDEAPQLSPSHITSNVNRSIGSTYDITGNNIFIIDNDSS